MLDIEQYLYRNMQAIFHDTTLSVEKHGYYFLVLKEFDRYPINQSELTITDHTSYKRE